MKYKALIFDMDGTLVHNMPFHNEAWRETLAEAGVTIEVEAFNRSTTGKTTAEILRLMLGPDLSQADLEKWAYRKETLYREAFLCCREPLPGLLTVLEQAHKLGLPMAVATAAPPGNVPYILDELDLRRHFNVVVGGHQVQRGKPDPEIFLKAAEALGMQPADCLVFEDAVGGIEAARRAGMDAVMIMTTMTEKDIASREHVLAFVPDFTTIDLEKLGN